MSQANEISNYTILSEEEVSDIYKKAYKSYLNEVRQFFETHKSEFPLHFSDEFLLRVLTKSFLFLTRYNINPTEKLLQIMQASSLDEIQSIQDELNEYAHSIKQEIMPLIAGGKAKRILYGIEFSNLFKKGRIYLKTNPILSETEWLEDIVGFLNYPLLRAEKFSFDVEIGQTTTLKGKVKPTKSFRIIQNKQAIRPVKKLKAWEEECRSFHQILSQNAEFLSLFFNFIQLAENNKELSKNFNTFKKENNFPFLRVDTIILRHLKAYRLKSEKHLLYALETIANQFKQFHTSFNNIITKEGGSQEYEEGIDMIILSTRPHDIATMSTFADWESCMSIGGLYYQDIMMQIGAGSIIAYGVNSKNPEKRLARVLLKPFETAKTHKQRINYCHELDTEVEIPAVQINPNLKLDYADIYDEKVKFIREETAHLEEADLILDPHNVERIYRIDRIYGLQNPSFSKILSEFARQHLDTPGVYGQFMVADPMYLDGLSHSYQIYDKRDKDNLIKYLIDKRINYYFDSDNLIHVDELNISNVENLYLRPLSCRSLTVDGFMLDRPIEYVLTDKLIIQEGHTFKSKTFPQAVHIEGRLSFQDSEKEFHMPFGIVAPEVDASETGLASIAPDLKTNILKVDRTKITSIPPIRVQSLDASKCYRLTHLAEDLSVKNRLILEETSITSLPPLSVSYISIKRVKTIKALNPDMHFTRLNASGSGLESIPLGLVASSFIAPDCAIKHIPCGTRVKEVDLKGNPLETIGEGIEIPNLIVANTLIKELPHGLKFYKLDVSGCPHLKKLPDDIEVSWSLNASNSGLQELPAIETENIAIVGCQDISFLPEGIRFKKLLANQTNIRHLPSNTQASIITINCSQLETIGDNVYAEKLLDVKCSNLTHIGENLTAQTLIISGAPIRSLPSSMNVQKLEAINCTNLTDFPAFMVFSEQINISKSGVSNLSHITTQGLIVSECKSLEALDETVQFQNLMAAYSGLKQLPDNLTANEINLNGCPIEVLPQNLTVQKLDCAHTNLIEVPQTLKAESANFDSTNISSIPAGLEVSRLVITNTYVHTIHYSEHLREIVVNHPIQCIHPSIANTYIKGMREKDIKNAKNRYRRLHLQPQPQPQPSGEMEK